MTDSCVHHSNWHHHANQINPNNLAYIQFMLRTSWTLSWFITIAIFGRFLVLGGVGSQEGHDALRNFETDLDSSMKWLLSHDNNNNDNPADFVLLQHIAHGHLIMARRMLSFGDNSLLVPAESVLKLSVSYFERAHVAHKTIQSQYNEFARQAPWITRQWGDALNYLNRTAEATSIFRHMVDLGYWKSTICRPTNVGANLSTISAGTYFIDEPSLRLESPSFVVLERKFSNRTFLNLIKHELSINGNWKNIANGLTSPNDWLQLPLIINNQPTSQCDGNSSTICEFLLSSDIRFSIFGQTKFSVMTSPNTTIRPHAGPTNERLRVHCTIANPNPNISHIFVGTESRQWHEGSCFAFDESCEHSVQIGAIESPRVVLIVDIVNPYIL